MKMEATMFLSPKINMGERAAGGTVAFYTDSKMNALMELWSYADLAEDSQGGGRIANPVPVDGWGINSSPIFYAANKNAWYVVSDARGAVIRQGYVHPYSWQDGGSAPDGESDWGGIPDGDWFWGLEVVGSAADLESHDIARRPLFLATGAVPPDRNASGQLAGDRSGGLVVWAVPGTQGDGVITFNSSVAGTVWKAREKVLFYSYLQNAAGVNPFWFLETNYPGEYDVNLDAAPNMGSNAIDFSGRVIVDRPINSAYAANTGTLRLSGPSMLEIRIKNAFSGSDSFWIDANGGDWSTGHTLRNGATCVLTGRIGTYRIGSPAAQTSFRNARIDFLENANPANIAFADSAGIPSSVRKIGIAAGVSVLAADLERMAGLEAVSVSTPGGTIVDLAGSGGFAWDVEAAQGSANLTCSTIMASPLTNYFYAKPSKNIVYDNTFYATNAEFYSEAVPGSTIDNNSNQHHIGTNCSGLLLLNAVNNGKLFLDDCPNVDVDSKSNAHSVYATKNARSMKNCIANLSYTDTSTGLYYFECPLGFEKCTINFDFWNDEYGETGVATNSKMLVINKTKMNHCNINLNYQKVGLLGSELVNSHVSCTGFGWSLQNRLADIYGYWDGWLVLMNNSKVEGTSFSSDAAGAAFSGDIDYQSIGMLIGNLRNIKFNNNTPGNLTKILMPRCNDGTNEIVERNFRNYWVFENVQMKANYSNHSGSLFMPVCSYFQGDGTDDGTGTSQTDKWMKGHIEITGRYDLSVCNSQMPTGEFPDPLSINGNNTIFSTDDPSGTSGFISALCVHVFGDPLKYASTDGTFVLANPWTSSGYKNMFPNARTNMVSGTNGSNLYINYCLPYSPTLKLYRIRE